MANNKARAEDGLSADRATLTVRKPSMDFSDVRPHWARSQEVAQYYNASSLIPSYIEPYLIRVMRRAIKEMSPEDQALVEDMELFNEQELEHSMRHNDFNKMMREKGYPGLAAFEKELAADYVKFLKSKSLKFNIAYSEGFEAIGSSNAETFFQILPLLERSADPKAVELWKWHLAEEFEHRHVCYDVYHRLFGGGLFKGYFYRCYGYLYAYFHLGKFTKRVAQYLIDVDRQTMDAEALEKSHKRLKRHRKMMKMRDLRQMFDVLSPFYNPSKKPPNQQMSEYLDNVAATQT